MKAECKTEQDVINCINKKFKREAKLASDKFSRYDAEDKNYLYEIKIRDFKYLNCLIEKDKLFNNLKKADQLNKYFIYVVCFDKKIAIFNITKLVKQKYNFKWEKRKLPKSTMLNEKKKLIYKNVGYINLKDTSITINIT